MTRGIFGALFTTACTPYRWTFIRFVLDATCHYGSRCAVRFLHAYHLSVPVYEQFATFCDNFSISRVTCSMAACAANAIPPSCLVRLPEPHRCTMPLVAFIAHWFSTHHTFSPHHSLSFSRTSLRTTTISRFPLALLPLSPVLHARHHTPLFFCATAPAYRTLPHTFPCLAGVSPPTCCSSPSYSRYTSPTPVCWLRDLYLLDYGWFHVIAFSPIFVITQEYCPPRRLYLLLDLVPFNDHSRCGEPPVYCTPAPVDSTHLPCFAPTSPRDALFLLLTTSPTVS